MSVVYATMTSKGQITLPSAIRRAAGLRQGQKVAVRLVRGEVVITPPPSLAQVRQSLREEGQANGTWGSQVDAHQAWIDHLTDRYGNA